MLETLRRVPAQNGLNTAICPIIFAKDLDTMATVYWLAASYARNTMRALILKAVISTKESNFTRIHSMISIVAEMEKS